MHEEYESIMKNDVWDVVPRPEDKAVVTSKWLYKIKHGSDGSDEGIDYDDIFAPLAQYTTIRSIIALVATQGWNLH